MIVFGDPQFSEKFSVARARLQQRVRATHRDSLDELRALLIQSGQLEQAVADAENLLPTFSCQVFEKVTDLAARAFFSAYAKENPKLPDISANVDESLILLQQELEQNFTQDFPLTLKIPEGYEFYALYPEQYCLSAARWAAEHRDAQQVLVVGIRSIGTSLSAIVATVLNAAGLKTTRLTLRPKGNPIRRTATLPGNVSAEIQHALIVDEGPGISGSSMSAAADALLAAGMARKNISFFPGNENQPAAATSESTRQWWNSAPRFFTPLDQVRWNGKPLRELLLEKTNELCQTAIGEIEFVGNGLWRKWVYKNENDWPAVGIPFERAKFLCGDRNGVAVLWKFEGLGSAGGETSFAKRTIFQRRANEIQMPEWLGSFRGFSATRWIEGERLRRADETAPVLNAIAQHLNAVVGQILTFDQIDSGITRLSEMVQVNLQKVFQNQHSFDLDFPAESCREFFHKNLSDASCRSYGDGRVVPHEWIRTSSGLIFKADCGGHDTDHTMIGKQPMLWDVAGVLVEWDLSPESTTQFLKSIEESGTRVDRRALQFFTFSYAAFRMGQCFLCAEMNSQSDEQKRLLQAAKFYQTYLARLLTLPKHHSTQQPVRQNHRVAKC